MDDCRFCAIAAGERDAHVLYEDDVSMAFLDSSPATDGHTLVIPKSHVVDLVLADAQLLTSVLRTARRVAKAMDAVLEPDGFSTFHSTGTLVGDVEHAHLHLLPRERNDGIRIALDRSSLDEQGPGLFVDRMHAELADR